MDVVLLIAASGVMLAAHFARATRWALLLPTRPMRRFSLLLGLSLGYLVNMIVPLRVGEVVRAWFVSEREQIRLAYVGATVVAERLTDLLVVGVIGLVISIYNDGLGDFAGTAFVFLMLFAAGVACALLVRNSRRARLYLWTAASIFNERVRFGILDLFWSYSELVVAGKVLSWRYATGTVVMWALYILSYRLFGSALGGSTNETVHILLGWPLLSLGEAVASGGPFRDQVLLLVFTGLPVLGVVIYGVSHQRSSLLRLLSARFHYGGVPSSRFPTHTRERFKNEAEYQYFLTSLFSGDDHAVTGFGLRAVEDGIVHKLFNGGSDAVTSLVGIDGRLLIRKFALGPAGAKLKVQADWLATQGTRELPLVDIVGTRAGAGFYRYDMPLVVPATDLYDVVHTQSAAQSEALFADIIRRVATFHECTANEHPAAADTVEGYLATKAAKNAADILSFVETMLPTSTYEINGTAHDLADWDRLLDPDWLAGQIRHRGTCVIHGDLTIENIIVAPTRTPGWYIIDPNPENIFDTPMIDWAKLMQSLHLGYEGLNRGVVCSMADNTISLSLTRSHVYSALHAELERFVDEGWGADGLREVYFHELVNYLRLTPYKIRQDALRGLTFFTCTSILLRRYIERWP
jgi:hypothetical protein